MGQVASSLSDLKQLSVANREHTAVVRMCSTVASLRATVVVVGSLVLKLRYLNKMIIAKLSPVSESTD